MRRTEFTQPVVSARGHGLHWLADQMSTHVGRKPVGGLLGVFFQAEDGIRDDLVTGVQTCALPIYLLSAEERAVIEPASVIGLAFERPPVEELVPEPVRPAVEAHLVSMTQKQLVRRQPEQAEHSFRFQHILVRDAAYQGILKRARAGLHERFADWAERTTPR